jgi:hypothetical protein
VPFRLPVENIVDLLAIYIDGHPAAGSLPLAG